MNVLEVFCEKFQVESTKTMLLHLAMLPMHEVRGINISSWINQATF